MKLDVFSTYRFHPQRMQASRSTFTLTGDQTLAGFVWFLRNRLVMTSHQLHINASLACEVFRLRGRIYLVANHQWLTLLGQRSD